MIIFFDGYNRSPFKPHALFNPSSVDAKTTIVKFRIPQGDRPSLDEIRSYSAGLAGLTGLMNLMEKCWEAKPDKRPSSHSEKTPLFIGWMDSDEILVQAFINVSTTFK